MRVLLLISFITYSMCIEVTLPWTWHNDKETKISNIVVPVFNFDGDHEYISLYIFESLRGTVDKVNYKTIRVYTNHYPEPQGCKRMVYHLIGVLYEVVIITLGRELGLIEAAYYITDNKIYDIWSLNDVMMTMLEGHSQLLKQIVSNVVYSKLPNMLYISSFDLDSIKNGSLVLLRTKDVKYYPDEFIDPLVESVLDRVLVGTVNDRDVAGPSGQQRTPLKVEYSSDDED